MTRRRWTDDDLRDALAVSRTYAEILRRLGLRPVGANYRTLHAHLDRLGLDTSHLLGHGWARGVRGRKPAVETPLASILAGDVRHVNTDRLRRRLIRHAILDARCDTCGISEWRGQPAPLELDHKNGDRFDHRLANLRLLCPNCHAQTSTYRGRNIGGRSPTAEAGPLKGPK